MIWSNYRLLHLLKKYYFMIWFILYNMIWISFILFSKNCNIFKKYDFIQPVLQMIAPMLRRQRGVHTVDGEEHDSVNASRNQSMAQQSNDWSYLVIRRVSARVNPLMSGVHCVALLKTPAYKWGRFCNNGKQKS